MPAETNDIEARRQPVDMVKANLWCHRMVALCASVLIAAPLCGQILPRHRSLEDLYQVVGYAIGCAYATMLFLLPLGLFGIVATKSLAKPRQCRRSIWGFGWCFSGIVAAWYWISYSSLS